MYLEFFKCLPMHVYHHYVFVQLSYAIIRHFYKLALSNKNKTTTTYVYNANIDDGVSYSLLLVGMQKKKKNK